MMTNFKTPGLLLFGQLIILSIVMSITTSSWMILWGSLELNLISFIPLLILNQTQYEMDSAIIYFMIQSMSSVLLFSALINQNNSPFSLILMILALLMKLGGAPFHLWIPSMVSGLSWTSIFLVLTIQKFVPYLFLSSTIFFLNTNLLLSLSILTIFAGSLGGLNQTYMRPLIAYSSITHSGWLIIATLTSNPVMIIYFMIYTYIMFVTLKSMLIINSQFTTQFNSMSMNKKKELYFLFLNLLSLAGMPPLLGFLPKLMMIVIITKQSPILMMIMFGGTYITTFFYFSVFFYLALSIKNSILHSHMFKYTMWTLMQMISTVAFVSVI